MPTIYELAKQFRLELLRRESETSAEVLSAFETILTNLEPKIKALEAELENNKDMSISRLFRLDRYKALQTQTKAEIERFSVKAAGITERSQTVNVSNAFRESKQMIETGTSSFVKLPSKAVREFAGLASDGSPLEKVFNEISKGAAQKVKEKLQVAIALGQSPKKTASDIRQSFGTSAHRALVISRTESLRAHRTATLETYKANKELVGGWYWLSARTARTCAMCFAMDGTRHTLNEDFASHPCCRCSMVCDLGKSLPKTGAQVFAGFAKDKQIEILGRAKHELYSSGKIALSDLVEKSKSAKWGVVRREKTLKEL